MTVNIDLIGKLNQPMNFARHLYFPRICVAPVDPANNSRPNNRNIRNIRNTSTKQY